MQYKRGAEDTLTTLCLVVSPNGAAVKAAAVRPWAKACWVDQDGSCLNGYEALAEEKNDGVRKDVLIIL